MKQPGIYQIRNLVTDMRYVGSTGAGFGRRFLQHRRSLVHGVAANNHLQASWNKHGPEAFVFEPLAIIEPALLTLFEQRAFDISNSKHGCYNQGPFMDNPMRGKLVSSETRRKLSEAGKKQSVETRRRISEARKGMIFSIEHRHNLSQSHIGKKQPAEARRKLSEANKGRIVSSETRLKLSSAARNRSIEYRLKLSRANKGHSPSVETRHKMSESAKKRWSAE